jgi:prepilin-type N-terminal cleavage/methylation domain-containing protein
MSHRRIRAFTLVELLVVVSIIGLLMAIMLPALAKSREAVQKTQCASNLRQIGIATAAYLVDNRDVFMRGSYHAGNLYGDFTRNKDVYALYSLYLGGKLNYNTSLAIGGADNDTYFANGLRFSTIGVFICSANMRYTSNPADPGPLNFSRNSYALWAFSGNDFKMTSNRLYRATTVATNYGYPVVDKNVAIWSDRCNLTNAGGNGGPAETNHWDNDAQLPEGGNVSRIDGSVVWYPYDYNTRLDPQATRKFILPHGAISGSQTAIPSGAIYSFLTGWVQTSPITSTSDKVALGRGYRTNFKYCFGD